MEIKQKKKLSNFYLNISVLFSFVSWYYAHFNFHKFIKS